MEDLPRISIIVPSFNQGHYIEQTICSVIDQLYNNYELIVIDGGSTDNTVEIIKKYQDKISYWVSEKDNGQADAINKGLAIATGAIFNWLNSDDYLAPGALQTIGEYFSNNPEKNVLCGFTRCFFDENDTTSHIYRMGIKETPTDTILHVEMNQPGTFYRTDIVRVLGGVNPSLRYVFDNELWFRFLAKHGIATIGVTEKLLAAFRLHKDSKSVYDGHEAFDKESKTIDFFLAEELCFADDLILLMKNEVPQSKYEPTYWDHSFMDRSKMEQFFAAHYMLTLLQQGNYHEARLGWEFRFKKEFPAISRMLVSTFTKLFVLPGYFKK